MPLNLMSLLQAATGVDDMGPMDIPVTARRTKPAKVAGIDFPGAPDVVLTNGPDAPDLGNRSYAEAAKAAMSNTPEHKGMFGTKGTLRDILGTIGDAFLINSGNKAIYEPQRMRERMGDALSGFTDNPLAALERAATVDPEFAQKAYNDYQQNDVRNKQYERTLVNDDNKRYAQYADMFASYAGSATPETWGRIKPMLEQLKKRGGLGDEFSIPDVYDENALRSYQFGGMKPNQQIKASQDQTKTDNNTRDTDSKISDRKARTGIASRNADTNASRASETVRHNRETESQGRERIEVSKSKGSGRRSAPPPPASDTPVGTTGKYVLRNGKFVKQYIR